MSLQKFGLRYERLLVLSAPISLACILVAFVAIASDFAKDKTEAQCRDVAANIVEKSKNDLQKLWEKREKIGKLTFANEYVSETSMMIIKGSPYPCKYEIGHQDTNAALPPEEFASKLRADANNIREQSSKRPVRSYGIELPEKATISLFGTKLMISIYTLTQVMQIVLFPILILWLGSLFNTRYRETILIGVAAKISDLYPHVINVYMNATLPPLRKKSWAGYYLKTLIPYFPALVRIFLLSIFIMPPTIFYCASLFYLSADEHAALAVMAGFLVIIFSMTNAISELSSWHAGKTFPGPKLNAQR